MPIRHIGAAALLLGALGAATAQAVSPQATSEGKSDMKTSSAATAAAPLRTLGEYTDPHGIRRLYLLVSPNLSDAQIMTLAQAVHAKEKSRPDDGGAAAHGPGRHGGLPGRLGAGAHRRPLAAGAAAQRSRQALGLVQGAVHRHAAGRAALRACTQPIPQAQKRADPGEAGAALGIANASPDAQASEQQSRLCSPSQSTLCSLRSGRGKRKEPARVDGRRGTFLLLYLQL